MKFLKKNQIILSTIAILMIAVGYLSYNPSQEDTLDTATLMDSEEMASIGDATFVSSSSIATENEVVEQANVNNQTNTIPSEEQNNTIETSIAAEDEVSEYFTESRLQRDKMYAETLESYQKIVDSTQMSSEQKNIAQTEIQNINQEKNAIMITENLIKTKGFEEVILFVNIDSISVIIKAEELNEEEIAQIQNIVSRELKAEVENIHISIK